MPSVKSKIQRSLNKGNKIKSEKQFVSSHKLDFGIADWVFDDYTAFKVGTCEGLYSFDGNSYQILAITNDQPNNGHFEDVLEWFEHSCKRDKKNLMILEVWNLKFKKHLIDKRGFIPVEGTCHVVKYFI